MTTELHAAPSSHASDRTDLYGGLGLGLATLAALVVANSALEPYYTAFLHLTGEVRIGAIGLAKPLEHWINDGLMALFFLLVGLEIKREACEGALASMRQAALPVIAAIGGFVVPALIYIAFNHASAEALRGWAVPAATDISFAIGVCALLGRAVPRSLKTFLLALAIIDDLMAIIVIAIFYTDALSLISLALAGVGIAGLAILNLADVRKPALYLLLGLFTWVCVLKSGVHATLAGVAVGFAMPLTRHDDDVGGESLLVRTEHALKPWVSYGIIPLFAFANAGVPLAGASLASLTASVPLGIIAGLFIGKQVGVFGAATAALKLGIAQPPADASVLQLYGVAVLTGIGFTMSLFIGTLAFDDDAVLTQVRVGVLAGSILAATVAALILGLAAHSGRGRHERLHTSEPTP
jgi:NhaA family Na+:H+ antiporter